MERRVKLTLYAALSRRGWVVNLVNLIKAPIVCDSEEALER